MGKQCLVGDHKLNWSLTARTVLAICCLSLSSKSVWTLTCSNVSREWDTEMAAMAIVDTTGSGHCSEREQCETTQDRHTTPAGSLTLQAVDTAARENNVRRHRTDNNTSRITDTTGSGHCSEREQCETTQDRQQHQQDH